MTGNEIDDGNEVYSYVDLPVLYPYTAFAVFVETNSHLFCEYHRKE